MMQPKSIFIEVKQEMKPNAEMGRRRRNDIRIYKV